MPVANPISQLYELDRVETGFVSVLNGAAATALIGYPLNAQGKRDKSTNDTPRTEVQLNPKPIEGRRKLFDTRINNAVFQPYNTWEFELWVTIITNRSDNTSKHLPMMGAVRWELTMYRLLSTWTETVAPYHSLIDLRDTGEIVSYDSEQNLDSSKIIFTGMFQARENSWPQA